MKNGDSLDFTGKTALKKWQEGNDSSDCEITKRLQVEPIENACWTIKRTLEMMYKKLGCDETSIYITGAGNFRKERATILPYKGNRDPLDKPVLLPDLREYLVRRQGAVVVDGMEADDAIGIDATRPENLGKVVVCAQDKDLRMIPGYHYNFTKKDSEVEKVSANDAWRNFFSQLLTGDTADNIPGIPGVGTKTAEKILEGYTKPTTMWCGVFRAWHDKFGNRYNESLSLKEALQEVADLLWIRRHDYPRWVIP